MDEAIMKKVGVSLEATKEQTLAMYYYFSSSNSSIFSSLISFKAG